MMLLPANLAFSRLFFMTSYYVEFVTHKVAFRTFIF